MASVLVDPVLESMANSSSSIRRALGDFLYFSAPQHVLLWFVVRGNLLDGLANTRFTPKSLYFLICSASSPSSSTPNSTLPNYPTLEFPPASHDVLRFHSLGLRLSPLRRLSVQVLLRPLMDRSLTAASASGPLRTPLLLLSAVNPSVCQCPDSPQQAFQNLAHLVYFSPLSRALES
ncbi:hypothetical protein PGT21_022096 [Puccinia graminis f. sp. tritici]|uniref:Uncharacterized protein n=1 Tax=Puccinia graminis f. sp. tritici TaxID=56615 RepID=A0A5B0N4C1_PUCGR|nr:hypothetical protein PGT21_022096 [Puccinia graminis f. sp. tritici]